MPPTILLSMLGKNWERETHKGGENSKIFNPFSLSLPKSRGVGPDARALENTNASSLARRYKTSARTVESPKLWPSLRGRALCDSNRKREGRRTQVSFWTRRLGKREKTLNEIVRREKKNFGKLCDFARKVSSFKHRAFRFLRSREKERERERERETCLSSHAHGPNHDDKAQARFAFPKVLHVPHF